MQLKSKSSFSVRSFNSLEYIILLGDTDAIGGLYVSEEGTVEIKVSLRSIFLKDIEFETRKDWNEIELSEFINSFGERKAGARWKKVRVVPSIVPAGTYFPRVARPTTDHPNDAPRSYGQSVQLTEEFHQAVGQLRGLIKNLEEISEIIEFDQKNLDSFGPRIRSLLILASTEFEAVAKSVLRENNYPKRKTNISDYEKLDRAMKISEYVVRFPDFPALGEIIPFKDWAIGGRLAWYAAYNDVKHDRYLKFDEAKLGNCLSSVAGVFVLLCASFGWRAVYGTGKNFRLNIEISKFPLWGFEDMYRRANSQDGEYFVSEPSDPIDFPF